MTFQIMALVMTCAGSLLGVRFIVAGRSVLKEWGLRRPLARWSYLDGLARSISASP